ncbi:TIGR04423 family type III CRISPR-associated protein [Mangrovimonas sp. TPBH4]|uniref:TIGR04423 family type III CRISPR-associated protein n=1 Tax=Mangrovimonas sp. TPBH4 TaxID=1645914 RepID=UPI0006B5774E|nr:TIGR04423 family type III CRISPR-associated protein [Mangrovimonas sp. TPBH4]
MAATTYNTLTEIPKIAYEGYVWLSNQKEPQVLLEEEYNFNNLPEDAFVIEALLYSAAEQKAIHIGHTGNYRIIEFNLKAAEQEGNRMEDVDYLPHRLGEQVKAVSFKNLWAYKEDSLCEGMPVLQFQASIFCGFKKQ